MSDLIKDYSLFARSEYGIGGAKLDSYEKYLEKRNGYIEPYILEERQMNVTQMSVFSRLFKERILFLGTEINSDSANIIISQLMYLNSVDSESDIKLFLNTPGGSCTDGLQIYDVCQWVNCDVATYNMGLSASMGSILLSSGAKGKRFALPHSRVMIHQPMGGVPGGTQESDFAIAYEEIKKCKKELYNILVNNTGKSYEEIEKAGDRDCWFTAQEALDFGLIDEIIRKKI